MGWHGLLGLLAALMSACMGSVGAPDAPLGGAGVIGQSSHDVRFSCSDTPVPSAPLARLSRLQYENTLRDLLRAELPSHAELVWQAIAPTLADLPPDSASKIAPFATMDQAATQQHIDTYFRVGQAVAQALTAEPARVQALLACEGKAERECIDAYLRRFARRAFRHAPSASELSFLREVYADSRISVEALRDVIVVVLNAPMFLYRVELGADPLPGGRAFALSGYELATRLAYHFWQTTPSDELLAQAESGALARDESYARVVGSMLADERAEASMRTFVREWLHLDALRPLELALGDPAYDAFVGADAPSPELRDAMIDETLDSFVFHVQRDDSFADWLLSPYSFAQDPQLAAIYRTPRWSGSGEPPRFPEGERAGLLTRGALLATGTTNTRPIMRGVFVRERLLCDELAPPPANAASLPAETTGTLSTREIVERLTEQPGSNCSGCHARQINPLGFVLESYDALGRVRTSETRYDESGRVLVQKPLVTEAVPRVWSDDESAVDSALELGQRIAESGKAEACFARHYLRFAYGRSETEQVDGCALEAVRSALREGRSLQQALEAPALRPEFRQRVIGVSP